MTDDMPGKKIAVVFGATGQQGGSVVRALVRSGEYTVRGITRDATSSRAQALVQDGVELVNYDLNDRIGLQAILQGAHVCFVNTATNFKDSNCLDTEIAQGCRIADHCKAENVGHVVFSSQLNSHKICSLMARHLVAKADIEQYMRDLDLPLTCVIMPLYFEDICGLFRPSTHDGTNFDIEIPTGGTAIDMMSAADLGAVVVSVLRHRDHYLDKTVSVCGDKITVRQMAHVLSEHLRPKQFRDKQMTAYDFDQRRANDLPGSADWANMFQFFMRVDQKYNLADTKKLNPDVRSFDQWVQQNVAILNDAM